jgi:hypothetical protein
MEEEVYKKSDAAFSLKICRDGMILLRIEALEQDDVPSGVQGGIELIVERWGEYLDYLNSFYLLLDSSTIKLMNLAYFNLHEITIRDTFRVRYEDGKIVGHGVANESVTSVFQMGRYKSMYALPIPSDPKIVMRQVISTDALANAAEQFSLVVNTPGLNKLLASFTKSIGEYKVGNYETSIILAWFISETMIRDMWKTHVSSLNEDEGGGQQRINCDRRDYLIKGRDFTIASVTNILELFHILRFDLFKKIDSVRSVRNKIVHREPNYSPKAAEAQLAITTARELCTAKYGIDFNPSFSYSVSGF